MDLDIRHNGSVCLLKLKGSLKFGEPVTKFDEAWRSALASGHIQLVFDLSMMPFIDSCGIGAIVNALREAKKHGGDVRLVDPSPFALKTFKMVAILSLFSLYATEAEAIAASS